MHRINSDGSVNNRFVDGDPSTGTVGTVVDAAFMNSVQEELSGIVEGFGNTLSSVNNAQIWNILQLLGIRPQNVTGNSYEVPGTWRGSTLLSIPPSNFAVTSYFRSAGVIVFVVPKWGSDSPDSISFIYGNSTVEIPRGSALVAIATDTQFAWHKRFLVLDSDNRAVVPYLTVGNINSIALTATAFFTSASYTELTWTAVGAKSVASFNVPAGMICELHVRHHMTFNTTGNETAITTLYDSNNVGDVVYWDVVPGSGSYAEQTLIVKNSDSAAKPFSLVQQFSMDSMTSMNDKITWRGTFRCL